ncbi:MAG: peptidyl-prolyl cis-trans isomerase [Planctomycetes bacterium]|nr:peptidyl-prolyl cis-trans isomerase [Planctomycetota bacterium]
MIHRAHWCLALTLLLWACSSPASNPDRDSLAPVSKRAAPNEGVRAERANDAAARAGGETSNAAEPAAATGEPVVSANPATRSGDARSGGSSDASALSSAATSSESARSTVPATGDPTTTPPAAASASGAAAQAPAAAAAAPTLLPIARVEGRALDVRRFLTRVWIRDSSFAREVLDQLVVAELAVREADRLGIQVAPERVDAGVQRALDALAKRLEEKGSKASVEEHVEKNLGLDFALYKSELERDALMQLLAERCVRTFALASERAIVSLAELPDRAALDAFQAELSAGGEFAALVQKYGTEEIKQSRGARMTLFDNQNSKLSRLVFATEVGALGGPLEEGGRFLLVKVEERLAPKVGSWAEVGTLVEASLASDPVDDLEYAQWKTWVGKVYDVDLDPFLELVGEKRP